MGRRHLLFGFSFFGVLACILMLTACEGVFGSDDEADPPPPEIDPPYHLTAEKNKDGFTVLLTWNMDTGQEYDGFTIERGTPSMHLQEIDTVGKTTLNYGDSAELDAGTYYYRVGATQDQGKITYCERVTVEITAEDPQ